MKTNAKQPKTVFDSMQEFFRLGMDRTLPPIAPVVSGSGKILNLGAGNKLIPGTIALDRPRWIAGKRIPLRKESADAILAFHFFEHLPGNLVIEVLKECQRVLKPDGTINICVPFWRCQMAVQDLTHQTHFAESTWKTLLCNKYYDPTPGFKWQLEIGTNLIMGIDERNLAIFTQLIKR